MSLDSFDRVLIETNKRAVTCKHKRNTKIKQISPYPTISDVQEMDLFSHSSLFTEKERKKEILSFQEASRIRRKNLNGRLIRRDENLFARIDSQRSGARTRGITTNVNTHTVVRTRRRFFFSFAERFVEYTREIGTVAWHRISRFRARREGACVPVCSVPCPFLSLPSFGFHPVASVTPVCDPSAACTSL